MSVTARVNLHDIQSELTEEHKVEEIHFDVPSSSALDSPLTVASVLYAATNAAGLLPSRSFEFALWKLDEQNDLHSKPLSLSEVTPLDSFQTTKFALRKRNLNKDTKGFTKAGAKAELAGPFEQVLEKSRQFFSAYNKWSSSNMQPDGVDQALTEFTEALDAFVGELKALDLPTDSFGDLQDQATELGEAIGELQNVREESSNSPNKKKNKKKKTGSQQEMGMSFEKQAERLRTRLNSFLSQLCIHVHFVATCTDALASASAAKPSSESPRQVAEVEDAEVSKEPETPEIQAQKEAPAATKEEATEDVVEQETEEAEDEEAEDEEDPTESEVPEPTQTDLAALMVLTDQKILNIEAESQVGKSQTPQEPEPKAKTPQTSRAPAVVEASPDNEDEDDADDDADEGAVNVKSVFFQQGGETKKAPLFLTEPPFAPKIASLFEKKFGSKVKDGKIYICDPGSTIFYELENYHSISEGSILKIHRPSGASMGAVSDVGSSSVSQDIQAIKDILLSERFQRILSTPEQLEAENKKVLDKKLAALEMERSKLSKNIKDTKAAQKKLAGKLRLELDGMKSAALHLKTFMGADLATARGKLEQTKEAYKKLLESSQVPVRELEVEKTYLTEESEAITNKLEDLKDIIEQIKTDVTKRKSKPSRAHLTYVKEESESLVDRIDKLLDRIKTGKAKRKKIWEVDLQAVMKEQKAFKDLEESAPGFEDDLQEQLELFDKLEKVALMQEKRKATPLEFFPPEEDVELDQKDKVGALLSAIQSKQLSEEESNKRLKAMALAEKTRKIELEAQVDEFEDELVKFVGNKKFKNTGGFEEIEQKRREKDRLLLKGLPVE